MFTFSELKRSEKTIRDFCRPKLVNRKMPQTPNIYLVVYIISFGLIKSEIILVFLFLLENSGSRNKMWTLKIFFSNNLNWPDLNITFFSFKLCFQFPFKNFCWNTYISIQYTYVHFQIFVLFFCYCSQHIILFLTFINSWIFKISYLHFHIQKKKMRVITKYY